ncbi:MAG: stage II sporulation protein P [Thermacetogeniaceae bacterium]
MPERMAGQRQVAVLPSMSVLVLMLLLIGAIQFGLRFISWENIWQNVSFRSCLSWELPDTVTDSENIRPVLNLAMISLTGIDPNYLPGILEHGLPASMESEEVVIAPNVAALGTGVEHPLDTAGLASQLPDLSQKPVLVAIYHTHNAETYIPYQGQAKVEGQNGGVSLAGNEMVKVLAETGIRAVHDLTIHDYPDFPTSYIKSEPTAKKLVQQNKELQALLDVHRDAGLPFKETVRVGNEDSARVMIVVGNGQRGLPDPNWRENYAFAQEVAHRLQERYPGVLKKVLLMEGRYNQHVFPHAILVEVGSEKNTLDEVLVASRCFAEALTDVIKK